MPPTTDKNAAKALTIEELTAQYNKLAKRQTEAETRRDVAQKNLENLRKQAKESYGTDDIEQLKTKLQEMTAENERKRAEYQTALAKIEVDLANVEAKFASANDGGTTDNSGK